ncbi:MAG TPA: helix-turn-helix domain-containing protein [Burkholderiaceae bacterium]|nr:helix-turn-helix domain-containing protein [Burkholderiaceae bacterium]
MKSPLSTTAEQRLHQIELARQAVIDEGRSLADTLADTWFERGWIERSWRRCLDNGQRPGDRVAFDMIPAAAARRTLEANHPLIHAARPVLDKLGRAIANTRYFAILTDAEGVVIDVNGPIDHSDPRAHMIARVGVDLSERSVGTAAISAALNEQHPVWLHRGEHFFSDTAVYSCAGSPLFGPDGRCVGMLDLTGIETAERPELKHLVAQSARSIENALTLSRPHTLLVRLNWPGRNLGDETDGLVCLDSDGWITGANQTARQMVPQLGKAGSGQAPHISELLAVPHESLFDAARRNVFGDAPPLEIPLWSGLRLHGMALVPGKPDGPSARRHNASGVENRPLKDVEIALIRRAVDDARGNVMLAAQTLGISRATVYRKLGNKGGK